VLFVAKGWFSLQLVFSIVNLSDFM